MLQRRAECDIQGALLLCCLQVVIVEEAGEVFEAHILASLAPTTEHLILIGDHEQLRPKPQLYALQASFKWIPTLLLPQQVDTNTAVAPTSYTANMLSTPLEPEYSVFCGKKQC